MEPKPPVNAVDLVLSLCGLLTATIVWLVGVLGGYPLVVIFRTCFTPNCEPRPAHAVQIALMITGGVVLVAGIAVTIALLHKRMTAWPWAVAVVVLCVAILLVGDRGYSLLMG